jgi:5-methyltetrahydrofolate--homocysteine methyltransferase
LTRGDVEDDLFPAVSEGDDVIVLTEPKPDAPEHFRFTFPRQ